jgi:hypothetical protein
MFREILATPLPKPTQKLSNSAVRGKSIHTLQVCDRILELQNLASCSTLNVSLLNDDSIAPLIKLSRKTLKYLISKIYLSLF